MTTLPGAILQYQEAHDHHETEAALATFTTDATVRDDGYEYRGTAEIRNWLSRTSVEYSYTSTLKTATPVDQHTWLITNHLEGNFPGGVVDLHYRYVLAGSHIRELEITP